GLPRYNEYLASSDDAWIVPGDKLPTPYPLAIEVPPVDPHDPLPNVTMTVSRYLRYANLESRRRPAANGPLDPVVKIRISTPEGRAESYDLVATDPQQNTASDGRLAFTWIDKAEMLDSLKQIVEPVLHFAIPAANVSIDKPVREIAGHDPNA